MSNNEPSNLPAQIADAVTSVAQGLVPGMIKSLDRLVGAVIDIPVAKLAQQKAKIDAQTESYKLVEAAISQAVVAQAGGDPETAQRAMEVLVRKEYRKQLNREAVAKAMVEDLLANASSPESGDADLPNAEPDEDWLNLFERYSEDASSERLQGLWGRVLAGEIRRPGKFSARTLRFLSEFSQADALTFEIFAKSAFGEVAPNGLVKPSGQKDIRHLIHLEANGLIQGAAGLGLSRTLTLNDEGYGFVFEGSLAIVLKGEPNTALQHKVVALTPLGQELLSLVPSREPREAAKAVALALRVPEIHECYLGTRVQSHEGERVQFFEILWLNKSEQEQVVEGSVS